MAEPDKPEVRGPFSCTDVPWEESAHGARFGMRFRELGVHGGGTHVGVCLEELQPGMQANPLHYHMLEEEHLLILEGELTLILDGQETVLRAGDTFVQRQANHGWENRATKRCRMAVVLLDGAL